MTEPEQPQLGPMPSGIGILDVVLAAAQAWKAIFLLGLVFGFLAWVGARTFLTPTYEATAELRLLDEEMIPLFVGSPAEQSSEERASASDMSAVPSDEGSFFIRRGTECMTIASVVTCSNVLHARATTPERAQSLLAGVISRVEARYSADGALSWAEGVAKKEVDIYEQSLRGLRRVIAQLRSEIDTVQSGTRDVADYADAILVLEREISDIEQSALVARQRLQIHQQEPLVRDPGPPVAVGVRPELVALVAAIVSMLIVLNLSLLRLYISRQDPQSNVRIKLRLIREAFGLPKHG